MLVHLFTDSLQPSVSLPTEAETVYILSTGWGCFPLPPAPVKNFLETDLSVSKSKLSLNYPQRESALG